MNRAESLDKAWRLAAKEKDFSLVDELYHAEYKSIGGVSGAGWLSSAPETPPIDLYSA